MTSRGKARAIARVMNGMGGIVAVAALLWAAPSATAQAQDGDSVSRGLRIFRDIAICRYCHGWDGRGALVEGYPPAPTLVETLLGKEEIIEAVSCGRPRPGMPRHRRNAWTAEYKCYEMVKEEIGEDYPDEPQRRYLSPQEIEDVADYVIAFYKNGPMTFEKCQSYYAGQGSSRVCDQFK